MNSDNNKKMKFVSVTEVYTINISHSLFLQNI